MIMDPLGFMCLPASQFHLIASRFYSSPSWGFLPLVATKLGPSIHPVDSRPRHLRHRSETCSYYQRLHIQSNRRMPSWLALSYGYDAHEASKWSFGVSQRNNRFNSLPCWLRHSWSCTLHHRYPWRNPGFPFIFFFPGSPTFTLVSWDVLDHHVWCTGQWWRLGEGWRGLQQEVKG